MLNKQIMLTFTLRSSTSITPSSVAADPLWGCGGPGGRGDTPPLWGASPSQGTGSRTKGNLETPIHNTSLCLDWGWWREYLVEWPHGGRCRDGVCTRLPSEPCYALTCYIHITTAPCTWIYIFFFYLFYETAENTLSNVSTGFTQPYALALWLGLPARPSTG